MKLKESKIKRNEEKNQDIKQEMNQREKERKA